MIFFLLMVLFCVMISFLIFFVPIFLFSSFFNLGEKKIPFECGFSPISSSRIPFSTRFFLLAVIFMVFDLEIILLLPFPMIFFFSFLKISVIFIFFFCLILFLGLFHELNEGSLSWKL